MNRTDAGRTSAGRDGVVLATRTPDRARALAEALRKRRLRLILSPLRAPRALTEPELDALRAALGGGPWEAATFTSVNGLRGLRAGLARLHAAGRSVHAEPAALLAGARVHCVGRATAAPYCSAPAVEQPEAHPGGAGDVAQARFWTGLRPMTPDGTPVIGATKVPGLYLNTGHGTLGWTMACGSGRYLADVIAHRPTRIRSEGLDISRYGRGNATPELDGEAIPATIGG